CSCPGRDRNRRRWQNPRTSIAPTADRRSTRAIVVLDRPGQRAEVAQPAREFTPLVALLRDRGRIAAGTLLRSGNGVLPRFRQLPATSRDIPWSGSSASAAPGHGGAAFWRAAADDC